MALPDYKSLLNQAILAYQAKVGLFLQCGEEINTVESEAHAYDNSTQADVAQRAQAIEQRAQALMTQFNAVESQAQAAMTQATALQGQLQTPAWQNILSANWSVFGSATLAAAQKMVTSASSMIQTLTSINAQMSSVISNTAAIQSDMTNLDDYAQGKGVLAPLSKMVSATGLSLGGLVGNLGSSLKYIGIAAGLGLAVFVLGESGAFSAMLKKRK